MNPDVAAAVAKLEQEGVLPPAAAAVAGRAARRELVSLHAELRVLAYAGVLLAMAGVGLLVRENLDRIGPTAIALALAVAALACFGWVFRHAPPFSREAAASTHLGLDYVLLLGALLAAADLAYVEVQFTPLGESWAWHLLVVAGFYALLAVRFDSRVLFSLALSTFAAWRGVSSARIQHAFWGSSEASLRAQAAFCGAAFLALGWGLRRRGFKAHFEPAATHLGWFLLLVSPALGLDDPAAALVLLLLSVTLVVFGYRSRQFSLLAMGVVGGYVGLTSLLMRASHWDAAFLWFAVTPLPVIALLLFAHHRLKVPD